MKPPRACRTIEGEEGRRMGEEMACTEEAGDEEDCGTHPGRCLAILGGWSSRYIARYPADHLLRLNSFHHVLSTFRSTNSFPLPINRASSPPPSFSLSRPLQLLSFALLYFSFFFLPLPLPPPYFLRGNRPSSCSFSSSSPSPLLLLFSTVSLPLSRAAERHTHTVVVVVLARTCTWRVLFVGII